MESKYIIETFLLIVAIVVFGLGIFSWRKNKSLAILLFVMSIIAVGSSAFIFIKKENFQNTPAYKKTCPSGLNSKNVGTIAKPPDGIAPTVFILKGATPSGNGACGYNYNDCYFNPNIQYKGIGAYYTPEDPNSFITTKDIEYCYCGDCNVP